MTLDQFLNLPGSPTASAFGAKCNPPISEASISRIRKGIQNVPRDTMLSIIEASEGLVSAEGLLVRKVA
jgi:hypothetical protein